MFQRILVVLITILTIAYPFFIFFTLEYFEPKAIAVVLAIVFVLRFLSASKNRNKALRPLAFLVGVVGLVIAGAGFILNDEQALKYYPVVINAVMLVVFARSLLYPPTVIELFARLQYPELPSEGVLHTRKVTIAWCLFFLINGSISLLTVIYGTMSQWVLYNGFISYVVMGLMFAIEYLIRRKIIQEFASKQL
ncbi:MAG: septation protein IspZ [Gammaproteobacteria bacterium]|nr:septation protein IspZ [Gammaproteobacteria bacterium]MDH5592799.1 septation protein IspZ [Gammaproteobacteria bacterium]